MNTATYIVVPLSLCLNFVLFVGLAMRPRPSDLPTSESPREARLFVDIQQLGTPLAELQSRLDLLETEIERRSGSVTHSADTDATRLMRVPLQRIRNIREPENPDTLSVEILACMDDPEAQKDLLKFELGSLYNEIIKRKKELVSKSTLNPLFGDEYTIEASPSDVEKFAERYREIFRRYMRNEIADALAESATDKRSLVGKFAWREEVSLDAVDGGGMFRVTSESAGTSTMNYGAFRRAGRLGHYVKILELRTGD